MAFINSSALVPRTFRQIEAKTASSKLAYRPAHPRRAYRMTMPPVASSSHVEEKGSGMRIIKQADEAIIDKLQCRSWNTWTCDASTFPWSYNDHEVCLVISGEFSVVPDDGDEPLGKLLILTFYHLVP